MKILIHILLYWGFNLLSHAPCVPTPTPTHRSATIQQIHHPDNAQPTPAVFAIRSQGESSANVNNRLPGPNLSVESQHLLMQDRLAKAARQQRSRRLLATYIFYQRRFILKKLIFPFHTYL